MRYTPTRVAILPYYIANLNIEYTYKEKTGQLPGVPQLVLSSIRWTTSDWQERRAEATREADVSVAARQSTFNLGGLSTVENWMRIQEQNEKPISVIIGNPPYNDSQSRIGMNSTLTVSIRSIDQRIHDTYVAEQFGSENASSTTCTSDSYAGRLIG